MILKIMKSNLHYNYKNAKDKIINYQEQTMCIKRKFNFWRAILKINNNKFKN